MNQSTQKARAHTHLSALEDTLIYTHSVISAATKTTTTPTLTLFIPLTAALMMLLVSVFKFNEVLLTQTQ